MRERKRITIFSNRSHIFFSLLQLHMFLNLLVCVQRRANPGTCSHAGVDMFGASPPPHSIGKLRHRTVVEFICSELLNKHPVKRKSTQVRKRGRPLFRTLSRHLSISGRIWGLRKSSWLLQPADPLQVCHFRAPFFFKKKYGLLLA